MKVDTMRRIDYYVGVPLCFLGSIFHKTLKLFHRSLMVARAAKTNICNLFSFAHSILLRFAAQFFKKGLFVGSGLFMGLTLLEVLLYHPLHTILQ